MHPFLSFVSFIHQHSISTPFEHKQRSSADLIDLYRRSLRYLLLHEHAKKRPRSTWLGQAFFLACFFKNFHAKLIPSRQISASVIIFYAGRKNAMSSLPSVKNISMSSQNNKKMNRDLQELVDEFLVQQIITWMDSFL